MRITEKKGNFKFDGEYFPTHLCPICKTTSIDYRYQEIVDSLGDYLCDDFTPMCCMCWKLMSYTTVYLYMDGENVMLGGMILGKQMRSELEKEFGEMPVTIQSTPQNLQKIFRIVSDHAKDLH